MIERSILFIDFQDNSKEAHELGKSKTIKNKTTCCVII